MVRAVFLSCVAFLFLSLPSFSSAQYDTLFTYSDSDCDNVAWIAVKDGSQCRTSVDPKYYGMYETSSCDRLAGLYFLINVKIYDNAFCQGPPVHTYTRPLEESYYCTALSDGSGHYARETCSTSLSSFGLQMVAKYYSHPNCLESPVGYNFTATCVSDGSYIDPSTCSPLNNVLYVREVACSPSSVLAPFFVWGTLALVFALSLVAM